MVGIENELGKTNEETEVVLYSVKYEDGDVEDLYLDEIRPLLKPKPEKPSPPQPPPTEAMETDADAETTEDEPPVKPIHPFFTKKPAKPKGSGPAAPAPAPAAQPANGDKDGAADDEAMDVEPAAEAPAVEGPAANGPAADEPGTRNEGEGDTKGDDKGEGEGEGGGEDAKGEGAKGEDAKGEGAKGDDAEAEELCCACKDAASGDGDKYQIIMEWHVSTHSSEEPQMEIWASLGGSDSGGPL